MSVLDFEPLKVIAEVVNLKEEDLVTPEGGEKGILKINLSMRGIEPGSPA